MEDKRQTKENKQENKSLDKSNKQENIRKTSDGRTYLSTPPAVVEIEIPVGGFFG